MLTKDFDQLVSDFPLSFSERTLLQATETNRFSFTQTFDSPISKRFKRHQRQTQRQTRYQFSLWCQWILP